MLSGDSRTLFESGYLTSLPYQPPFTDPLLTDTSGNYKYEGFGPLCGNTSLPTWKIKRTYTSGGTITITYADGNLNYDNIWDNRASTGTTYL
jgi:hypothetical protein